MKLEAIVVAGMAILATCPALAQDSQPSLLPGGANALSETHGAWTVNCQVLTREDNQERQCALIQRQTNQQGQNVLAIELRPGSDGISGAMILPFGLAVTQPVNLTVDGGEATSLSFSTCIPAGCIVPIEAASTMLDAMRAGTAMTVTAQRSDNGALELPVSLTGLSAAITRITALANDS